MLFKPERAGHSLSRRRLLRGHTRGCESWLMSQDAVLITRNFFGPRGVSWSSRAGGPLLGYSLPLSYCPGGGGSGGG